MNWDRVRRLSFKFCCWLLFGVFCGGLPLGVDRYLGTRDARHPTWGEVTAHGELIIVSALLVAAAVGDVLFSLVTRPKKFTYSKGILVALGFVSFAVYCVFFAGIKRENPSQDDMQQLLTQSRLIFMFACITSGASVILAEADD